MPTKKTIEKLNFYSHFCTLLFCKYDLKLFSVKLEAVTTVKLNGLKLLLQTDKCLCWFMCVKSQYELYL